MAHQLKFAVDGVVNANDIFSYVGGLRDGRNVLVGAQVWVGESARIQFEDSVLVDQVGRDDIAWEGLSDSQTVGRVDQKFVWIRGGGNHRYRPTSGNRVRQRRSGGGEIVGCDGIRSGRRTALNQPAPFFIHKEECSLARVVVDVG